MTKKKNKLAPLPTKKVTPPAPEKTAPAVKSGYNHC